MSNTFIKEISQNEADMIKSFAVFYLLLVGNYVGTSIFTCSQITFINHIRYYNFLYLSSYFIFWLLLFLIQVN